TVTVTSSLRVRRSDARSIQPFSGPLGGGPAPATRSGLREYAAYVYRVGRLSGALTTTFAGRPAPVCQPLGACGTEGQTNESFTAGGRVSFAGSRPVSHRVRAARALADLRSGQMQIQPDFFALELEERLSERLTYTGARRAPTN
ncbi:MAG: hypothetical protein ACRDL5_12000, partial [Solirubrobacteraceae bacterium]